jgi:hypothetical protein
MDVLTQLSELDVADMMIATGFYESSESLIVNYRYTVLCVSIMEQENEIFMVLKHPLFEEIRVIIIPQRSHEPLRRMLNDENLLFLENSRYICDGEVILIAIGDQCTILM